MPLEQILASNLSVICDFVVTPQCIQTFYNFTVGDKAAKDNELGIFEDLGDVYAQEDLDCMYWLKPVDECFLTQSSVLPELVSSDRSGHASNSGRH